jgi:hypothetical protein
MVEAVAELPEAMREVFVLKHCQGWTLSRSPTGSAGASRRSHRSCAEGWRS